MDTRSNIVQQATELAAHRQREYLDDDGKAAVLEAIQDNLDQLLRVREAVEAGRPIKSIETRMCDALQAADGMLEALDHVRTDAFTWDDDSE